MLIILIITPNKVNIIKANHDHLFPFHKPQPTIIYTTPNTKDTTPCIPDRIPIKENTPPIKNKIERDVKTNQI